MLAFVYRPGRQALHADDPFVDTKPGEQTKHWVEAGSLEKRPPVQFRHTRADVAFGAAENLPGGHEMQSDDPSASVYVPAPQVVQRLAAACENAPTEQFEHEVEDATATN